MGHYDTKSLPIYKYLHAKHHPSYAILDNFFQSAFGGSYLNHQFLIAAAPPVCSAANGCPANATHSVLDRNGSPTSVNPPASNQPPGMGAEYTSPDSGLVNGVLTQSCGLPTTRTWLACGDYSVNTQQPAFQPSGLFGAKLPPQTNPTIGDRMSAKNVDWAWYSGGWSNANGNVNQPGWTNGAGPAATPTGCSDPNVDPGVSHWPECPDNLFQYHHQPFNYYAAFSTQTAARAGQPGRSPAGRAGVHPAGRQLQEELQPEAGQLHQADRRGERASRATPVSRTAATTWSTC